MGYTRLTQKQIHVITAYTFNLSTREVETGAIRLGGEENVSGKRQGLAGVLVESEDSWRQDRAHSV